MSLVDAIVYGRFPLITAKGTPRGWSEDRRKDRFGAARLPIDREEIRECDQAAGAAGARPGPTTVEPGAPVRVHLLGTRGSLPAPGSAFVRYGGNTSCVAVARGDEPPTLVLDAGTGLRGLSSLLGGRALRGSILLSHLHWDHLLGIPFLPAADRPDASVRLFMPTQGDDAAVLARVLSPPIFPIDLTGLRGAWHLVGLDAGVHQIEGFTVTALDIPHKGGRTFGFRIDDGEASIAYLSDHSPTSLGAGPHGDGAHHEAAVRLATGVDLLIHDSQYTPTEFAEKSDWGHCTYRYPVGLAAAVGAARTVLFHHDPSRTDSALDRLGRDLPDTIDFAVEGAFYDLPESDERR